MGFFAYLTHNDNDLAAGTITASSEDASYPKVNLTALPISKPFRFTGDTSENLQIDLGAAKNIDLVALINHNLTSAATITVNGGSTANPDGTEFTATITWREFDAFTLLAAAETWRYWKIIIADAANPDGFIQIGYLLMGDATRANFGFEFGWSFQDRFENLEVKSEFGVPDVQELFYQVRLVLPYQDIPGTDLDVLRASFKKLKRNLTPLFLVPNASDNEGYFGRFVNHLERSFQSDFYQDTSLEFEEESRGKKIAA